MKEHNDPSIFCIVLLICAVLASPAFAEMKTVNDDELAGTVAFMKGALPDDWKADASPVPFSSKSTADEYIGAYLNTAILARQAVLERQMRELAAQAAFLRSTNLGAGKIGCSMDIMAH